MIRIQALRMEYGRDDAVQLVSRPDFNIDWSVAGDHPVRAGIRVNDLYGATVWEESAEGEVYDIVCGAEAMRPGLPYTVRVTTEDADGCSDTAVRTVVNAGLPQWSAAWLGEKEPVDDRILEFRKSLRITKSVRYACAYVCGIGYAKLNLDGTDYTSGEMEPAFTEYDKRCCYQTIPFFPLHEGDNDLRVRCGSGWRSPALGCYGHMKGRRAAFTGQTLLSVGLYVVYSDRSEEWFMTDESWSLYGTGKANLFDGMTVDAGKGPETLEIAVLDAPCGVMSPQMIPPVRQREVYRPVSISEISPGVYGVDFGQNIAGVCRLKLCDGMKKGDTVTLRHMEFLDEDGSLYLPNLRSAKQEDTYIADGYETEGDIFMPEFTYHGFRYCEVRGYPRPLCDEDIEAVALYTDVKNRSSFRCGNALINAIHKNVVQTEKANIHSILTDCPQRDERMGWMNDATVRFEETPYNFDTGRLFEKVVRDIMDAQGEDGAITCTAPFVFGSRPADPVCSSFLVAGWQAYLHNGNIELLREAYPAFCAWDDCLEAHSDNGIVNYSYYGDWAAPAYACVGLESAQSAVTPGILMSTGYHYYNNVLLGKIARVLGEDPARHDERAEKIRNAFLARWWDEASGKVATGSQACQAFSLWLGILPQEGRAKAAYVMRSDLVHSKGRFTTGNLCTRYLIEELCEWGYTKEAWDIMTREAYPSYGYMIAQEATTVWERFELKKDPGMNSHDHPMYGAIGYWFYAGLCGMKSVDRGWSKAEIRPVYPEKLLSAQGVVDTPRGELQVRWVKRYKELHLYVTVPNGVQAHVWTPEGERDVGSGFHHWHAPYKGGC